MHDSLPGLPWASEDSQRSLSESITTFLDCGLVSVDIDEQNRVDVGLLSRLSDVDFRYWDAENVVRFAKYCRLVSLFLQLVPIFSSDP